MKPLIMTTQMRDDNPLIKRVNWAFSLSLLSFWKELLRVNNIKKKLKDRPGVNFQRSRSPKLCFNKCFNADQCDQHLSGNSTDSQLFNPRLSFTHLFFFSLLLLWTLPVLQAQTGFCAAAAAPRQVVKSPDELNAHTGRWQQLRFCNCYLNLTPSGNFLSPQARGSCWWPVRQNRGHFSQKIHLNTINNIKSDSIAALILCDCEVWQNKH